MKLLTRTTLYFVGITLLVFTVGAFIFYQSIRSHTKMDADERLAAEKNGILNYVALHNDIPINSIAFGDTVSFTLCNAGFSSFYLKDTTLYNTGEKELEPYRMTVFPVKVGDKQYRAVIFKPLIEWDDLRDAILQSLAIIAGILFVLLIVLNIIVTKTIWKPFYRALEKIKLFDITKGGKVAFEETTTSEFKVMNDAIREMTAKISSDYRSLKEFTENASHEIQTPLSVIQSKIELLIQSENLSGPQLENVKAIYEGATRLSKLNQALLLLTKIENRQFTDIKEVDLRQLVESKLELFKERIEHKKLVVKNQLKSLTIKTNPALADILINNLIGNAIKHNIEGGKLEIEIKGRQITISNSGGPLTLSPNHLFSRFKKANQASDSLGLGLAIVKEICNVYGFSIYYDYQPGSHRITVGF
jgi:signal transduction histidine kinase